VLIVIAILLFFILCALVPGLLDAIGQAIAGLVALAIVAAAALYVAYTPAALSMVKGGGAFVLIVTLAFVVCQLIFKAVDAGLFRPRSWQFTGRWRRLSRWDRAVVSGYGLLFGGLLIAIARAAI
jgi:hypothetical protein